MCVRVCWVYELLCGVCVVVGDCVCVCCVVLCCVVVLIDSSYADICVFF